MATLFVLYSRWAAVAGIEPNTRRWPFVFTKAFNYIWLIRWHALDLDILLRREYYDGIMAVVASL